MKQLTPKSAQCWQVVYVSTNPLLVSMDNWEVSWFQLWKDFWLFFKLNYVQKQGGAAWRVPDFHIFRRNFNVFSLLIFANLNKVTVQSLNLALHQLFCKQNFVFILVFWICNESKISCDVTGNIGKLLISDLIFCLWSFRDISISPSRNL